MPVLESLVGWTNWAVVGGVSTMTHFASHVVLAMNWTTWNLAGWKLPEWGHPLSELDWQSFTLLADKLLPIRLAALLLVAARIGGLVWAFPGFGERLGSRVRVALWLALTLVLAPLGKSHAFTADFNSAFGGMLLSELVLGATLGVSVSLVLGAIRLAAGLIDQQLGVTLSEGLALGDESGAGIASQLFQALAIVVFLQSGGHLQIVAACADSFRAIPLGSLQVDRTLGVLFQDLTQQSFLLAMRVAGPIWGATALAAFAWGFLGRALPAMSAISLGTPWRVLVGLMALSWGLPIVAQVVEQAIPVAIEQTHSVFEEASYVR